MNKRTLFLALALLLVAGGVFWLFAGGEGARATGPAETGVRVHGDETGSDTSAELERARDAAAELEPEAGPSTARDARRVASEDPPSGDYDSFTTDGAAWVDVSVLLPAGLPPDDVTVLLAFSSGDGDELDERDRRNVAEEIDLSSGFAREIDDDLAWARRTLAGSGSVRVPFHPDAPNGMLLLQSRYVYADPVEVDLDESFATIEGSLGAYVTGRCVIPKGAEDYGLEADDFDLQIEGRPKEGGSAFRSDDEREVVIRDDLTFELRALSSDRRYMVQAEAEGLVDYAELSFTAEPGEHKELALPFELGVLVTGRILGDDGKPIADADIEAESQGKGLMMIGGNEEETESAADGTYRLAGVAPGKVTIRVEAEGWVRNELEPFEVLEGQRLADFDIVLTRGNSVSGRVQWADGSAAAGVEVSASVVVRQGWPRGIGETETDEEGAFVLTGLEEGPFTVRAEGAPEGYQGEATRGLDSDLWEVFERVAEENNAAIDEFSERLGQSFLSGGSSDWMAVQEGVAANENGLLLILEEPLAFQGMVQDDTGAPVAAFEVEARPAGSPRWGSVDQVSHRFEAENGAFELKGVYPGEWMVSVEADGYSPVEESTPVVFPHTGTPLVFVMERGVSVTGTVVDPFGQPIAEAEVLASAGEAGPLQGRSSEEVESDDDGRFELEGTAAAGLTVVANHEDWAASEPVLVEVPPGQALDDLVVQLRVGGTITGEVFDEKGEPSAGQNVSVGESGFSFGGDEGVVTDGAGHFVIEHVTPGKVVVSAMPSEEEILAMVEEAGEDETAWMNFMGTMRMQTVEVGDGEEVHVVLGAKAKDPVRLHGTVTEGGSPVPEATVIALEEGGPLISGMKAARTDDNGRYELTLDRPGDFVLNVNSGDFDFMGIPFYVEVPEAPEFELDLQMPLGRIEGTVVGPDGAPVKGVSVRVSREGGVMGIEDLDVSRSVTTESDGAFAFDHLQPGTYSVYVGGAADFFAADGARFGSIVLDGIEVGADETVDGVDARLEGSGKLEGIVRDGAGAPVPNASIFVRDARGRVVSNVSMIVTNAAGKFSYDGLAPGTITVAARSDTHASAESGPLDIVTGETTDVELEVEQGTFLVVTLLEDDLPVRARVQVLDENGNQVNGLIPMSVLQTLFAEGFSSRERRIGPVPPGKYTLIATTPDGKDTKKSVRVKENQGERKVKLRLK